MRRNKILLFLVTAIVLVIFVAVVWTFISPAYNRVLVNLGNRIAPSSVTLELGKPVFLENITRDSVIVNQGLKSHLAVDVTLPLPGSTYSSLQTFTVNGTVFNTGEADALEVSATISISGPATSLEPLTKRLGTIVGGGSAPVSWQLQCTESGPVTIKVTATGTDENTGEPIFLENITPDSVIVNQELKSHLTVDVTLPLAGTTYSSLQTFTVNATVFNAGEADALKVSATVSISGPATSLEPLTKRLGTIVAGGSAPVSWQLQCTGSGPVTIEVTATGRHEDTEQRKVYFYHHAPEGTSWAYIDSWALHFGLVLVIALIGATPGLRLKQRLKFIALAFALLFVIHVTAIWVMARLMASSVVMNKNPWFNLLVTVGCDLFPVVIWGIFSFKYWFPQGLARERVLPAPGSHRQKTKKSK
ncbi:MAG: hypothetical protein FJ012_08690 [Chloroflexi bacterium]|nr:hypothetical protein [Chloroflexota bacterium]